MRRGKHVDHGIGLAVSEPCVSEEQVGKHGPSLGPHRHLPHAGGQRGADREAALLRSGRSGLVPVFRSEDWTIYSLPNATPILTGPADAAVDLLDHETLAGHVEGPGTYRLRVRWTPYRRVRGPVCIARAPDGMTSVPARAAGRFMLEASLLDRSHCG